MSPMTHSLSRSLGSCSISEVVLSLRNLQLNKVKSLPSSWNAPIRFYGFGSPRDSLLQPGFCSPLSTPTRAGVGAGIRHNDQIMKKKKKKKEKKKKKKKKKNFITLP